MLGKMVSMLEKSPAIWQTGQACMPSWCNPLPKLLVTGQGAKVLAQQFKQYYLPNKVLLATEHPSDLPLFEGRPAEGDAMIYVCYNKACQPTGTYRTGSHYPAPALGINNMA